MATCRSCGEPLASSARFCAACGTAVDWSDEPTRFAEPETIAPAGGRAGVVHPSPPRSGAASSGWLSSSGTLHGRFEPGAILAGRYRIVERLGQGGMGEVYRADDLKLGQPVALKFLPRSIEADPTRLAQFHNEVRLSRQISHKNVCRMYDVGDADGLPFLTMEYVDGEDLASLLRRIGRLPEDKALDIARQLCAGVAAAHERGVLHRDLKPANVMIDGNGQVRITDFGLAAVAGGGNQARAGTPAYMAPEQLAGRDATVQSDVYALGLVLYEVFTGRRAYEAQTLTELLRQQDERAITPPTAVVKDLDPTIERAILRAIDRDPALRPRSALAVAASLPGGDPLAAALAAGETPSPEMVAAAGEQSAVRGTYATLATVAVIALIALAAALSDQRRTLSRASLDRPPAVLVDRAYQVLDAFGYRPRALHRSWEFALDNDLIRYSLEHPDTTLQRDLFVSRPGALLFSLRTSPRALVPLNPVGAISSSDPPFDVSHMTRVVLDGSGRLVTFHAMPPQKDAPANPQASTDWAALFKFADLDFGRFHPVASEWLPRGHADARMAWEGSVPNGPPHVRVEAAAWKGRPTYFQIIWPWTEPDRMQEAAASRSARLTNILAEIATVGLLAAALFLARRNVRAGRGDTASALRLATVAVLAQLVAWAFNDPHVGDTGQEVNRFFESVGESLFAGGVLYIMHLAVEPAVRRYWPDSLLGWTRLLRGRIVDARVGRDLLLGLAAGALIVLLIFARDPLQTAIGAPFPAGSFGNTRFMEGPGYVIGFFASIFAFQSVFSAMWLILAIVGLQRLFKRMWMVGIAATVAFTFLAARDLFIDAPGVWWLNFAVALAVVGIITAIAMRVGLLATAAVFVCTYILSSTPWTFDTGAWYFPPSALAFLLVCGLAAFAGYAARTGIRSEG